MDPEHQVEVGLEVPWRKGVFVGKIDILFSDDIASDWKSSLRVPNLVDLRRQQQAYIYPYLLEKTGLPRPTLFNYVYLYGTNVAKRQEQYKTGPRKGQWHDVEDTEHPVWKYTWEVKPTVEQINKVVRNWAIPLARAMEEKIFVKQESAYNCNSCRFRTACKQTDLPSMDETEHALLLQEFADKENAQV
jgi:hypothetical protein